MIKYGLLGLMFALISMSADCQDLIVKERDRLYGLFEKKTMVVDFQFDSIDQQYDGSFVVRKAGKWGLILADGRETIPCRYDFIEKHLTNAYIASFEGKFGMIDTFGAVILDFLFDKIDHIEGDTQALVKYEGKWCIYKNGASGYNDTAFVFVRPDTFASFPPCHEKFDDYDEFRSCANEKMYKYIFKHLSYPIEARNKGIQGTIIVQFVVTRKGSIKDPVIRRGLGGGCDEEVLRMVNGMPTWIPAVQDGRNVASVFTLPVKFVLQR